MELSITDNSYGVLGDFILRAVTVFIFVCGLSLMIHELLFLLVTKQNSHFPFSLLNVTPLALIDSKSYDKSTLIN